MTSYTYVAGGTPAQPANYSYNSYTLTEALTTLSWPIQFQDTNNVTASIMNVVSNTADYDIALPDATFVGTGTTLIIVNSGTEAFGVLNVNLTLLFEIPVNGVYMFILTNNTTSSGTWLTLPFGGGALAGVTSVAAQQPAKGFTITGSPITGEGTFVFTLNDDLAGLQALNTTGFAVRTAPSTWSTVELTTANTNISITNPDGVAGNPLLTLGPNLTNLTSVAAATVTGGNISLSGNTLASTVGNLGLSAPANSSVNLSSTGTGNVNLNTISVSPARNITNINSLTSGNITISGNVITSTNNLQLSANSGIQLTSSANSNISLATTGNGTVALNNVQIKANNDIIGVQGIAASSFNTSNLSIINNSITSFTTNSNILIAPNGTGNIILRNIVIDSNSNVTGVNNLTVGGAISSFQVSRGSGAVNINGGSTTLVSSYNVASVTGTNGIYTITLTTGYNNLKPIVSIGSSTLTGASYMLYAAVTSNTPPNTFGVTVYQYSGGTSTPFTGSASFFFTVF